MSRLVKPPDTGQKIQSSQEILIESPRSSVEGAITTNHTLHSTQQFETVAGPKSPVSDSISISHEEGDDLAENDLVNAVLEEHTPTKHIELDTIHMDNQEALSRRTGEDDQHIVAPDNDGKRFMLADESSNSTSFESLPSAENKAPSDSAENELSAQIERSPVRQSTRSPPDQNHIIEESQRPAGGSVTSVADAANPSGPDHSLKSNNGEDLYSDVSISGTVDKFVNSLSNDRSPERRDSISSNERFSPILSQHASFGQSAYAASCPPTTALYSIAAKVPTLTDHSATFDGNRYPLRRPVSAYTPSSPRPPSPVRASSIEVLSTQDNEEGSDIEQAEMSDSIEPNFDEATGMKEVPQVADQRVNGNITSGSTDLDSVALPQVQSQFPPESSNSSFTSMSSMAELKQVTEDEVENDHDAQSGVVHDNSVHESGSDNDHTETQLAVSIVSQSVLEQPSLSRPLSGETIKSDLSSDSLSEPDNLPDLSYEQSFMSPTAFLNPSSVSILESLEEIDDGQTSTRDLDLQSSPSGPSSSPLVNMADMRRRLSFKPLVKPTSELSHRPVSEPTLGSIHKSSTKRGSIAVQSPQLHHMPSIGASWETPAATKQYMDNFPTRTAVTRKVESFQIPQERLAALQPDIAALQTTNRSSSDKLSLKESSLQIDTLQKENWGLKLKIMFLEKHYDHDQDKAALITENVRLQETAYNVGQQVKSRDRSIKSLEKQIADAEFAKATSGANESEEQRELQERLIQLEHQIKSSKLDAEERLGEAEDDLDSCTQRLREAEEDVVQLQNLVDLLREEKSGDGSSRTDLVEHNQELQRSLAELESEMAARLGAYNQDFERLEDELEKKRDEASELRLRVTDMSATIQHYECELSDNDHVKQETIEQIREVFETERAEYEMYIEDRHGEIENLKQALKSYDQDSFDARLSEAIKPHETAWRELNKKCNDLQDELSSKTAELTDALVRLESISCNHEESALLKDEAGLVAQSRIGDIEDSSLRDTKAREIEIVKVDAANRENLSMQLAMQETKCSQLTAERDECANQLHEVSAERAALLIELGHYQTLTTNLEQDFFSSQATIEKLTDDLRLKGDEIVTMAKVCMDNRAIVSRLQSEKDSLQLTAKDLATQLELQREQYHATLLNAINEHEEALRAANFAAQEHLGLAKLQGEELNSIKHSLHGHLGEIALSTASSNLIPGLLEDLEARATNAEVELRKLRTEKEDAAFELLKHEKLINQLETNNQNLQKKLETAASVKERLQAELVAGMKDKKLQETAMAAVRQSIASDKSTGAEMHTKGLNMLHTAISKLNACLAKERALLVLPNVADPRGIETALEQVLENLIQQMQLNQGEHRQNDAELRRKLKDAESQLVQRVAMQNRFESKMNGTFKQIDSVCEENETLQKQNSQLKIRLKLLQESATGGEARSGSQGSVGALSTNSANAGDDHWALHQRIKALDEALKYEKELRAQDDKAAKNRLAQSKQENKTLQTQIRRLEIDGPSPRSLRLDRNGSASEIRASSALSSVSGRSVS